MPSSYEIPLEHRVQRTAGAPMHLLIASSSCSSEGVRLSPRDDMLQGVACEVQKMTEELTRQANEMLPDAEDEDEDEATDRGRGARQRSRPPNSRNLKERLLESWQGMVRSA